jgi:TonB-linked SusC/RagA family outer membrane protein
MSMKRITLLLVILLSVGATAIAQSRKVSGRVLDETGQGLPGAGITVKGTTAGTVTDVDGNFSLDVPEGRNTLVVQSIGYDTREVAVSDNVAVRMSVASRELQGTVVTALALKREKRSLGYGTTTLSGEDLNSANNFSALSSIQGKTSGVNITSTTGGPGGSTRVVMRGEKSLQGNNQALIVVDGIPINNGNRTLGRDPRYQVDFGNRGNDVDPNDIESISVLKGAVAAALYGEAGANGAIMITTKSGKEKSAKKGTSFQYTTSYTLSDILKYPEFQNSYGQGDVHGIADDRRENFSWGLKFDDQVRPWGQVINGQQQVKPYSAQPDNVKSFFDKGKTWENNVQFGGANEKGDYFISLNALNNTGVVPNTFFNKYGIRFNGRMDLPNNMYSSINFNYINVYQRVESQGQGDEGIYNSLIQQPRDIPIWELKDLSNPFNSMGIRDSLGIDRYGYYGAYTRNPYFVVEKVDNRMRTDHVIASNVLGVKPNSNWDIFNRLGVDYASDRATMKIPKYNLLPYEEDYYQSGGEAQTQTSQGGYTEDNLNSFTLNDDLIANYTRELSKDLGLNVMGGANLQLIRNTRTRSTIDDQTNGLVLPDYYNLSNNQGPIDVNIPDAVGFAPNNESRRVSLYGQVSFNYQRFLFLELTGRNDWSSTLKPGLWSFFYPSASLSWVFSENLKNSVSNDILSYGKIRASYAVSGTGASAYANNLPGFTPTISATGFGAIKFPFAGQPGYTIQNSIGDPNLKPEITKTSEVGTELSFLRSRVNLDLTYYQSRTIDPIVTVPAPPSSGFSSQTINAGEITNKGVELQGRLTPVSTASGFRWELYGTYTKNVNKVVSLYQGTSQLSLGGLSGAAFFAQVGQPYGSFYATDLAVDSATGKVIVDSATGMPQLGANPVYKGNYQPRFVASWGTNLKYKGFAFNIQFDTKQGGVFFSRTKDIMDFVGTAKETENREEQIFPNSVYLSSEGKYVDNTTSKFDPYLYYTGVIPAGQHIVDASYVKLREASLTYTIGENVLRRTFLGSAAVSIYGNNLFIWTAKENKYVDPEMNSAGAGNLQAFDFSARMSLRNYGIRLAVTF